MNKKSILSHIPKELREDLFKEVINALKKDGYIVVKKTEATETLDLFASEMGIILGTLSPDIQKKVDIVVRETLKGAMKSFKQLQEISLATMEGKPLSGK